MRVRRVKLNGFRGLGDLDLELPSRTAVFVGRNGAGKSAILSGVAVLLSSLPHHLQKEVGGRRALSRPVSAEDITNWESQCTLMVEVEHAGETFTWSRRAERTLRGRVKDVDDGQARAAVQVWLPSDPAKLAEASLPMAVIYPTNRAVLDVPFRIRTRHAFDQLDAWSLHAGESQFRLFFEWFRDKEDVENQNRLRGDSAHRDRELDAVRTAISTLVPGLEDLRVERAPLRMLVTKQGRDIEVDQLSDGEKCLLAMVADLARRLCLANPSLKDPLSGEAVVLIDEIELHLHPAWQRTVIADLTRTFPNTQFLVSTHSPQVLGDVRAESVWLLERTADGVNVEQPSASFGRDSNRILEDLLGVPERREGTKAQLEQLFDLIDRSRLEDARDLLHRLASEIGPTEPEFAKAEVLMRRLELKRETDRKKS